MTSCDLNHLVGSLAATLLVDAEIAEPNRLDRSNTPDAPLEMATDQLVARKSFIQRLPGCRGDFVDLIASYSVFRQLGLLCFSVVLHERRERVVLHLTNPKSVVRHLAIQCTYLGPGAAGLHFKPDSFLYLPQEAEASFQTDEEGFAAPVLRLTNLADCQNDENDWQSRDTLSIQGGRFAMAEIVDFLVNIGRTSGKQDAISSPPTRLSLLRKPAFGPPRTLGRIPSKTKAAFRRAGVLGGQRRLV